MGLHGVFRLSLVFMLISFAASQRKRQSGSDSYYEAWSGSSRGESGSGGPMSSGEKYPAPGEQDAEFDHAAAGMWRLRPDRPFPQMAWTSAHVPLGMVEQRPLYPSSYLVKTSSGYQRTRDSSSDAKYTQDIFGHIPLPEPHKAPGFKGRKI
uniref:Uncharacterized protein n=1 Tax=Oryzias melastigma TaxID=30732 RepID=A0A3B3DMA8_ORYME